MTIETPWQASHNPATADLWDVLTNGLTENELNHVGAKFDEILALVATMGRDDYRADMDAIEGRVCAGGCRWDSAEGELDCDCPLSGLWETKLGAKIYDWLVAVCDCEQKCWEVN